MTQATDREETLGEFLASRARRASDMRLAGDAIAAILTGAAIALSRGPAWDLRISTAACFFAFAIWGIADRDLQRDNMSSRMALFARSARIVAAACGFAAAAYLMLALLGRAIGRVIS